MYQLAWLMQDDPFVLLHLRGLGRDDLLARLHERDLVSRRAAGDEPDELDEDVDPDVEVALDAALRASALLAEVEGGSG
jgi:uncharacterized Zn finger protein